MFGILILLITSPFITAQQSSVFDDTILFDINWPGNSLEEKLTESKSDHIILTTAYKEKYKCILPNVKENQPSSTDNYEGPTPLELISPLFSQTSCSYRLESYWTYEVCHGRHIRQYHEDREGKKVKIQEYILGHWNKDYYQILLEELKTADKESKHKSSPLPVKKVDGVSLPYFEVSMGNGTMCELNQNRPRETKVIYVCYVHGKHEIFTLKETSTCMYEVVVLSPLLCFHPKYKPQETGENQISCMPLDASPRKPRNLIKMKKESAKFRKRHEIDHIRLEFHPLDLNEKEEIPKNVDTTPIDTSPVENFLAGKNCLNGGTGWWKYEFCYGKSVEQYHLEKNAKKVAINLGRFNKEKHLEWLKQHPHKRPKPQGQRTQLSHLYSDGDVCDKTGKPRQTEIKLKCWENAASINAVSLYLLEPKYCEYILGVESPLICDILTRADEDGLVPDNDNGDEEISTVNIVKV